MAIKTNLDSNECWVYILQNVDRTLTIGITGNLTERLEENQSKLVYFRYFSDTLSALGFKLVLQQLSMSSVKLLIRDKNPMLRNLIDCIE